VEEAAMSNTGRSFTALSVLNTVILIVAALPPVMGQSQQAAEAAKPRDTKIPREAAQQPNPVKPTVASLARGKRDYGYDCAVCHGTDGGGKGDLAADMKLTLKDYRDPSALKGLTDGEIFYIIQNGRGAMTGEGDRRKPSEIWDMVNYVRSLSTSASKPRHKTASR
jgi:mono/diheme cytochrome c family protein